MCIIIIIDNANKKPLPIYISLDAVGIKEAIVNLAFNLNVIRGEY